MTQDLIRYDVLVQDALRGVVKKIVAEAVKAGLPGQHHFYISFDTQHPGVRMSTRLRQRYPDEMTVVLQHQFWDLAVTDAGFEVGLSFSGIPERLYVPFNSIKGFFDPSVQFGLQFEPVSDGTATDSDEETTGQQPTASIGAGVVQNLPTRSNLRVADETRKSEDAKQPSAAKEPATAERNAKPTLKSVPSEPVPAETATETPASATIVSIDSFRKKT